MGKSDVQPLWGARESPQIAVPADLAWIDQDLICGFTPGFCLCLRNFLLEVLLELLRRAENLFARPINDLTG